MTNNAAEIVSRTTTSVTIKIYSNHTTGPEAEDAPFSFAVAGLASGTIAPPVYQAGAVVFDGSSYLYRNTTLTGVANSPTGLMSLWIFWDGSGAHVFGNAADFNDLLPGNVRATSNNVESITGLITGNNLAVLTPNSSLAPNTWTSLIVSWDTNFGAGLKVVKIAINDVVQTLTIVANSGVPYSFPYSTRVSWAVGAYGTSTNGTEHVNNSLIYQGYMADFQFWAGIYLDLSVDANRRLFIDADGKPVDPTDASSGVGSTQTLLFSGDAATFGTNQGTGGSFTTTGTLTDAPTSPSD